MEQVSEKFGKEYHVNYNKNYYQSHRTDLLKKASTKVMCDICNKPIAKSFFYNHTKTDKHVLNQKIKSLNS